jgi:hypothetical protein
MLGRVLVRGKRIWKLLRGIGTVPIVSQGPRQRCGAIPTAARLRATPVLRSPFWRHSQIPQNENLVRQSNYVVESQLVGRKKALNRTREDAAIIASRVLNLPVALVLVVAGTKEGPRFALGFASRRFRVRPLWRPFNAQVESEHDPRDA